MFDAYSPATSNSNKEIDFDALNSYVVETAGLQERETLVGVVAGIVDLGTQEQEDAEVVFTGNDEDEAKEIAKNPNTYFKDGFDPQTKKTARLKCWPQKPIQSVAVAIDFPDIIVDKGQFFGNSNPMPLRLWLGGTFYIENTGMIVARPTPLKVVNINKNPAEKAVWSFSANHLFYKMAVASKLIQPGQVFLPRDIDQLVGKPFQFEAQVFFKENKGKSYYTEYVKFIGALGRKQEAPDLESTFIVQFNQKNDPAALKNLRNHVINTIKRAHNYEGSVIKSELEAGVKTEDSAQEQAAPVKQEKPAKQKPAVVAPPAEESVEEDDSPF